MLSSNTWIDVCVRPTVSVMALPMLPNPTTPIEESEKRCALSLAKTASLIIGGSIHCFAAEEATSMTGNSGGTPRRESPLIVCSIPTTGTPSNRQRRHSLDAEPTVVKHDNRIGPLSVDPSGNLSPKSAYILCQLGRIFTPMLLPPCFGDVNPQRPQTILRHPDWTSRTFQGCGCSSDPVPTTKGFE